MFTAAHASKLGRRCAEFQNKETGIQCLISGGLNAAFVLLCNGVNFPERFRDVFTLTVPADQQMLAARAIRPGREGRPTSHLGIPPHHRASNCCSKKAVISAATSQRWAMTALRSSSVIADTFPQTVSAAFGRQSPRVRNGPAVVSFEGGMSWNGETTV